MDLYGLGRRILSWSAAEIHFNYTCKAYEEYQATRFNNKGFSTGNYYNRYDCLKIPQITSMQFVYTTDNIRNEPGKTQYNFLQYQYVAI